MDERPWQSSMDQFRHSTLPILKEKGLEIGKKAQDGDKSAKKVIEYYVMLSRSFDPMTHILMREVLKGMGYLK